MSSLPLAPELGPQLEWINSPALTLRALRGRVTLIAFWSAGSAYCHNLLEDLRLLQSRYSDGLSVIGMHTPRFEAERDPARVLRAIQRLGLRLPVAHDPDFVTWQHYGVRAWPTVAVIDAAGALTELVAGDLPRESLDQRVARLLDEAGAAGLRSSFDPMLPVQRAELRQPLAFPSGLAVSGNHLYVVDTGHHRILECSHDGRILRQFGSGSPGFFDGASAQASFDSPRGVALLKDALYVADTGNHALRRVRLLDGEIDTLAGSGRAGVPAGAMRGAAAGMALNAPWDIAGAFDRLYLAMAGLNQIWEFDLGARSLRPLAGSGQLAFADGSGSAAGLAQPAALALVQQTLYVADSAASAIRSLQLGSGSVHTVVGQGLWDHGDTDGPRASARLQYPLALALDPGAPRLWIADAYNDAVRSLRLGGGDLRRHDIEHALCEPAALAASPGILWVANSGSHEVLRVDLDVGRCRRLPVGE